MESNFISVLLAWVVTIYGAVSSVMMFYFWYLYAQDESFFATIIIGPIVGMFKGLFWIFFI